MKIYVVGFESGWDYESSWSYNIKAFTSKEKAEEYYNSDVFKSLMDDDINNEKSKILHENGIECHDFNPENIEDGIFCIGDYVNPYIEEVELVTTVVVMPPIE